MSLSGSVRDKDKSGSGGGDYYRPPAGTYGGRIVGVLDLGTHTSQYQGQANTARQVLVCFELTGINDQNAKKPVIVAKKYGVYYADDKRKDLVYGKKSHLRQHMELLRGKPYSATESPNPEKLVGAACLVTLTPKTSSSGNDYAVVAGFGKLPDGMTVAKASVEPLVWSYTDSLPASAGWLPDIYDDGIFRTPAEYAKNCHEICNDWPAPRKPAAQPSGQHKTETYRAPEPAKADQEADTPF